MIIIIIITIIAGYRLMTAAVCDAQLTVVGAVVYHSYECTSAYGTETAMH